MGTKLFGKTACGKDVVLYTLRNKNKMEAHLINYGAILVNLYVPDKNGALKDVVLGYDKPEDYFKNESFFGATVGPNANRIKNAKFDLEGITYQLDVNDGENNLHSHFELGVHKRIWDVLEGANSITFSLNLEDGNMGFPGNKNLSVTYTLTDDNALEIHYYATTDKTTLLNMTNHSYFNLKGNDEGSILDHILWLNSSYYTPVVAGAIPTGEIASVKNTPFDFTEPKKMGLQINEPEEQLLLVGGYDHNWVIDNWDKTLKKIARVTEPESKMIMEVYSDLPGVQFYAGNFIGKGRGKGGYEYQPRDGFCLETQYYPDSCNQENFPQPFFSPEEPYDTTTVYKFLTDEA